MDYFFLRKRLQSRHSGGSKGVCTDTECAERVNHSTEGKRKRESKPWTTREKQLDTTLKKIRFPRLSFRGLKEKNLPSPQCRVVCVTLSGGDIFGLCLSRNGGLLLCLWLQKLLQN